MNSFIFKNINRIKYKINTTFYFVFLNYHKIICLFATTKFIFYNFRFLNKNQTYIISKLNELGDIIACSAIFDYLSKEIKDKYVFYIIDDRIELEFNQNINYFKFNCYKVKSYYHWKLLKQTLKIFFKNTIIFDLNLNGSWCYKTKKKYFLNNTNVNEHNYYFYGNLFTSSALLPYNTFIENRNISKQLLILENHNKILNIENNRIKIIVHPSSNNKIRNWPYDNWEKVLKNYDVSKFQIIEIGKNRSLNIDNVTFFDSTSLNQIFSLISKSDLFVGVDSSFAHIAEIFNIPAVILIGRMNNFAYHIPYSSFYFKNKRKYLIRKNILIKDISTDEVQIKIDNILSNIYKDKII